MHCGGNWINPGRMGKSQSIHGFHVWFAGDLAKESILLTISAAEGAGRVRSCQTKLGKCDGDSGQPVNFGTMAHDHEIYMTLADTAVEMRELDALHKYAPILRNWQTATSIDFIWPSPAGAWVAHRLADKHAEAETRLRQALGLLPN